MDSDEYYKEEEVEAGEEVVVGVVEPQPVEIPLEVQVAPLAEQPESPFLVSPGTPLLVTPSPPQHSPVGDAPSFMGFYSTDDITQLEQWAVDARSLWVLQVFALRNRRLLKK